MATVTERIKQIQQPKGGYLPLSVFEKIQFDDGIILNARENINATLIGSAVDYMTRFLLTGDKHAFEIPVRGMSIASAVVYHDKYALHDEFSYIFQNATTGEFNDNVIVSACKLASFDVWYRNTPQAVYLQYSGREYESINPTKLTIDNIKTLMSRTFAFFKQFGPVKKFGFTFEKGYTATVTNGDGDFLTSDTLWDLKVAKEDTMKKSAKNYTLQILMYWIMGQHSGQEIFKGIKKIGIFNPRLNIAYVLDISKVSNDIIKSVENDVICYEK